MGEMSSMMGSVMKATQGPPDPGIQPTPTGGGGGYTPSALSSPELNPQPMGQGGMRLSELLARRR